MIQRPGNHDDRCAGSMTSPRCGSVLVPVVAAMLILLMMGVALSELVGAQRMQSVLDVDSAQAFWTAEAGLWHAAHEQTELSTAVTFAGGDYTVTKDVDDYTATATSNDATRIVSLTLTSGGGGGGGPSGPLDEAASVATVAADPANKEFTMDLVNISGGDLVIDTFDLSDDGPYGNKLFHLTLSSPGGRFYEVGGGTTLPTGVRSSNTGTVADRTIVDGASPTLAIHFKGTPSGTIVYTIILNFTDATSSTLVVTVNW